MITAGKVGSPVCRRSFIRSTGSGEITRSFRRRDGTSRRGLPSARRMWSPCAIMVLLLFQLPACDRGGAGQVAITGKTVYAGMAIEEVPVRVLRSDGDQWKETASGRSGYHGSFIVKTNPEDRVAGPVAEHVPVAPNEPRLDRVPGVKINQQDERSGKEVHMAEQKKILTNNFGAPGDDDQNSVTAGNPGPVLMQDVHLLEKPAHFDRERIPERVVHAKGAGSFEVPRLHSHPEAAPGDQPERSEHVPGLPVPHAGVDPSGHDPVLRPGDAQDLPAHERVRQPHLHVAQSEGR